MGYFDGVTDAYFKTDKDGNTVFYPWGIVGGKGFILPESRRLRFRNSIKKHMQIVFLNAILMAAIVRWWIITFFAFPLYLAIYVIWIRKLTEGLEVSTEKLSLKESSINSAKSYDLSTLWILEILSALFVVAGLAMTITSPKNWLIGTLSILFFSLCGYQIWRMIKYKKANKST